MNTSIPNISKPYLLDEFLAASDFSVRLFSNNIVGNENPISFDQPNFDGYEPVNLRPSDWNASVLSVNYATCTYKNPIVFNNAGNSASEQIFGYYVNNSSGDILWYEKFNTPKVINSEEGVAINIRVNLNKPGSGYNFVSLILNSSVPEVRIKNSTISIQSESWNGSDASGSLIDVTNRNFSSNNYIFSLLLKSNIIPSYTNPYTFSIIVDSEGFNSLPYNGIISTEGLNSFIINLEAIFPPPIPTPAPTPTENDLIDLFGPFDSGGNITFGSASEDSKFSFNFLSNAYASLPANMLIYINNILVASVDYPSAYTGKYFGFQYETYSLSGLFNPDKIYFTVPGPGPLPPAQA